jgi:hypothetical protein
MSTTLTYGFKLPQNGDKGSTWFPDIAFDIQRLNDHTHDGLNSAPINSANVGVFTQELDVNDWIGDAQYTYSMTVTIPNGKLYDNSIIVFRNTVTKSQLFLGVTKLDPGTYNVYSNDNTLNITAYYVS